MALRRLSSCSSIYLFATVLPFLFLQPLHFHLLIHLCIQLHRNMESVMISTRYSSRKNIGVCGIKKMNGRVLFISDNYHIMMSCKPNLEWVITINVESLITNNMKFKSLIIHNYSLWYTQNHFNSYHPLHTAEAKRLT